MKRIINIIAFLLVAVTLLSSCASNNYTLIRYETYELMSAELPFTVKKVPEQENFIIFGAMDGKLAQIDYEIHRNGEPVGKLIYRMAELKYAEEFSAELGCLGISGTVGTVSSTEKLGSYTVSYYVKDNIAVAFWSEADYAYSVTFKLDSESDKANTDEVREAAISLIATRK